MKIGQSTLTPKMFPFCCYCSAPKSCLILCHPMDIRLLCLSLSPGVCSNSCALSWWCYLTISSSAALFSFCLQFFLASGSFPMSQKRWSKYWSFSLASVVPMNIQDWFPLLFTGLISLQYKGLSRVCSSRLKNINLWLSDFFMVQLSHPYMITGKNHSFAYMDYC